MSHNYTKNQKRVLVVFVLYLAVLFYLVLFSETYRRDVGLGDGYAYNLEPFKEIRRFYSNIDRLGFRAVFVNLAGNVLAFIPFGFMLPVVSRKSGEKSAPAGRGSRPKQVLWIRVLFLTFLLSLCIECMQLITKVGSFDVDDLILNTAGGLIGFLLYGAVQRIRAGRRRSVGDKR